MKEQKIVIVGAGISGLIAATVAEQHGFEPLILEASERVGGRVKTDLTEGYLLDRGFQVLLTAYPMAQKYLDYGALNLKAFKPGARIYDRGGSSRLGDAFRDPGFLLPTLFSGAGSLKDKWKVFRLQRALSGLQVRDLFESPPQTTLAYLKDLGFSGKIIEHFFKPFFGGIFLEPELQTDARMFRFVYQMFAAGYASIPEEGMEAIPRQLAGGLKRTEIRFGTNVKRVETGRVLLHSGETIPAEGILIATDGPLEVNQQPSVKWHSCHTLYFETKERSYPEPCISLVPGEDRLVNTLHYPTALHPAQKGPHELLSVTVIRPHKFTTEELAAAVQEELKGLGISVIRLLKHYHIEKALPVTGLPVMNLPAERLKVQEGVFQAGDYLLYPSLNAAMQSGELAAKALIASLD